MDYRKINSHIILLLIVSVVGLAIAMVGRLIVLEKGVDTGTVNLTFVIILGVCGIAYLIILATLSHVIVPWIMKKLPNKKNTASTITDDNVSNETTWNFGGIHFFSNFLVIMISMTENGDPLENAIAERVNGIIKEEYLHEYKVNSISEAQVLLKHVVKLYNDDRPHMSIGNLTPNQIHQNPIITEKLWKNYYKKYKGHANILQD